MYSICFLLKGDSYNALPNQVLPQANSSSPYNPIEYSKLKYK